MKPLLIALLLMACTGQAVADDAPPADGVVTPADPFTPRP